LTGALERAVGHLLSLQKDSGHWEGEVVWCPMILAQYVIVQRIIGRPVDAPTRDRIVQHFWVTRTGEGVWGLHPESAGYVFVTALAYVALRLLGLGVDDPLLAPARRWLQTQPGGVLAIPSWGKLWLALVGLYEYRGINPCPPELFLLPAWLPVHPRRYYCHTRYIYLAVAYLYGSRVRADLGPITAALRRELFATAYETIDFAAYRDAIAPSDLSVRPGRLLRLGYLGLRAWERIHPRGLRRRALDHAFARILYEQRTSRYQALSPVNGLLNCLAIWSRSPTHPDLAPSLAGVEAWRWEDGDAGVRYAGARSQTWDTAFAVQALLEEPAAGLKSAEAIRRACAWLRDAQATSELPGGRAEHRDPALGGWCFSDGQHRWPVSDCTAEALSAILEAQAVPGLVPAADRIPDQWLVQAVEFVLLRQNADGGFGTYERRRGSLLLEGLNPSEMFGQCMTERSYVECTGSALAALARFRAAYPEPLRPRIEEALGRGVWFLRAAQRPDGAWPAAWGINFTYAVFHAVRGLRATGAPSEDPALARAAAWLARAQRPDGGWGEHHAGSREGRYVEHPESQVVMTAWALLALRELVGPGAEPVARGLAWLRACQRPDGSWPQQAVNGVFFGSAMLDYRLYKSYFPTWALARHAAAG
jgi:2,3-oxidosqualene cyclase